MTRPPEPWEHDPAGRSQVPIDSWSPDIDMHVRDRVMETEGGWATDGRTLLRRCADVLGKFALVLASGAAALLVLKLIGVPIS